MRMKKRVGMRRLSSYDEASQGQKCSHVPTRPISLSGIHDADAYANGRDDDHPRESGHRVDELIQGICRIYGKIDDGQAAAHEQIGVAEIFLAQPLAYAEQYEADDDAERDAARRADPVVIESIFEEESHADDESANADASEDFA